MEFTTGSSIMPQKRNYDLFEIIRWNIKKYFSCPDKIRNIISTIWSGYHRDLQLTKKPFIEGIHLFKDTVILLTEIIRHLEINKKNLESAMTPDLYVTEKVYDKVNQWESFRNAYLEVKKEWFKKS
jgi:argininosuccinate lyase